MSCHDVSEYVRCSKALTSLRARYEGTGRSLSLKLLQQLRVEGAKLASGEGTAGAAASGRTFREVQLQEPIRSADYHLLLETWGGFFWV